MKHNTELCTEIFNDLKHKKMEMTAIQYLEQDDWTSVKIENSGISKKWIAQLMEEYHKNKVKNHGDIAIVIESIWVVRCDGIIWHMSKDYAGAMDMWNKSQSEYPNKKMTIEQEDL